MCHQLEDQDTNHIMFGCIIAQYLLRCLQESFGWERIQVSTEDFILIWIDWVGVGGGGGIQKRSMKRSSEILFDLVGYLQRWRILMLVDAKTEVKQTVEKIQAKARIMQATNEAPG